MARRITETLVEDFAVFFRKRLLLDLDTEQLSKVIKVDVVRQKNDDMPLSPAIKDVLTKMEEGAEYLNILLKYLQHKQNGGKPWQFCLAGYTTDWMKFEAGREAERSLPTANEIPQPSFPSRDLLRRESLCDVLAEPSRDYTDTAVEKSVR
ncbi:hypothetical protein CSAL01_11162 [Colletotrichum salicis]|uniref:Uncharacterized protein n=1 Tax=Colletotrichum salicis TaxID=1209931 RepID=A0A135UQH3_9PEZI|nr:hypothetical protein CSAL01_11162 [Colletotrichum salicis]